MTGARPPDRALAPVVAEVRPAPDAGVLAAIVAAVDECWPRPQPASGSALSGRPATPLWRFSGRWWARPAPVRRERPWIGGTR